MNIYFINLSQKTTEVYFRIFTKAGRLSEPFEQQGMGHLLDHYINGKIFQKYFNLETNAHIDSSNLWFSLNTEKKKALKDIKKFMNMVVNPDFDDKELLGFEKQTLINEMRVEEVVVYNNLFEKVLESTFLENNYRSIYSEISKISSYSLEDLKNYHQNIIGKQGVIVFVGGYKMEARFKKPVEALVDNYLKYDNILPKLRPMKFAHPDEKYIDLPAKDKGQALVYLVARTFGHKDPTERIIASNIIFRELAGHKKNSPFLSLRKLGVYGLRYAHMVNEEFGMVVLSAICLPNKAEAVVRAIQESTGYYSDNGLTKTDIQRHKKRNSEYYKSLPLNNVNYFSDTVNDFLENGESLKYQQRMNLWKNITPELTRDTGSKIFNKNNVSTFIFK